jgi:hypothetical protein
VSAILGEDSQQRRTPHDDLAPGWSEQNTFGKRRSKRILDKADRDMLGIVTMAGKALTDEDTTPRHCKRIEISCVKKNPKPTTY